MHTKEYWDKVYTDKSADSVSWYQKHSDTSLRLIASTDVPLEAYIIDVGGGASTLVDDLLSTGFQNVSVLDVSETALKSAQSRLGKKAANVNWIIGDITEIQLPPINFDIWHDRAVFHFLVTQEGRASYKSVLIKSLKPDAHLILATFAEDGPTQCSGLPVQRYSITELTTELGPEFNLVHSEKEQHATPSGAIQKFNYCLFHKG